MTQSHAQANLLGAVALAISDRTAVAAEQASGHSATSAAALSALRQYLDHASLDRLCGVLGLTPSGTVRLVDRLSEAGLVVRGPGPDGRTRAVSLTAKGRRVADKVRAARLEALNSIIEPLTRAEGEALRSVLSKLTVGLVEAKDGGAWLCRLCDLAACGRPQGQCPTANAAQRKYGTSTRH